MSYKPIKRFGKLQTPQPVKITTGKYAGHEGIILDDKSCNFYKVNVTPWEIPIQAVDIHENDFVAIEKLRQSSKDVVFYQIG